MLQIWFIRILLCLLPVTSWGAKKPHRSDYCGSWYGSTPYNYFLVTFREDGSADFLGTGCTYRNRERSGHWWYAAPYACVTFGIDTTYYLANHKKLLPVDPPPANVNSGTFLIAAKRHSVRSLETMRRREWRRRHT